MFILGNHKIEKDEILICVIEANAYLTIGKEYRALSDVSGYDQVLVKDDIGETIELNKNRFVGKADIRDSMINLITKDDE